MKPRTPQTLMLAAALVATIGASDGLADTNLGRLSIARVYASAVNGDRAIDDHFYGAHRAFDAGSYRFRGIAYTYWLSGGAPQWLRVGFRKPVTVDRIELDVGTKFGSSRFPVSTLVRVSIEPGGVSAVLENSPSAPHVLTWRPATRVPGVRMVRFDFGGRGMVTAEEIQIFGTPPPGTDLAERTPEIDRNYGRRLADEAAQAKRRRRKDLYADLEKQIGIMRKARATLDRNPSNREAAVAWLLLNRASWQMIKSMNGLLEFIGRGGDWNKRSIAVMQPYVRRANAFGARIEFMEEIIYSWDTVTEGYENYLKLWPDGPDADEASWFSEGTGGRDFEASIGEWEALIRKYTDFLVRFPRSRFAATAKKELAQARKGLDVAKDEAAERAARKARGPAAP